MSTVRKAIGGGLFAGGAVALIALVVLIVALPAAIALGWWFDYLSFELAVILLLVITAYLSG